MIKYFVAAAVYVKTTKNIIEISRILITNTYTIAGRYKKQTHIRIDDVLIKKASRKR